MAIHQHVKSAHILQFMHQMFSSEYKANFQAVNSDLLLHAIIKSGGDIPLQQAELIASGVVLLAMGNYVLSLQNCNVSTDSSTFSYIYCIYFFF